MNIGESMMKTATPDISNDPFSVRDRVRQAISDQLSNATLNLRSALDWSLSSTDLTDGTRDQIRSALREIEEVTSALSSTLSQVEDANYPEPGGMGPGSIGTEPTAHQV